MYDYIRLDNIQGRTFNDVMKDNWHFSLYKKV